MATAIKAIPTLYGEDAIRFKKKVDEAVTMRYIQFYGCVYCFGNIKKKKKKWSQKHKYFRKTLVSLILFSNFAAFINL